MLKKIISLFTIAAAVLCGSLGVCAATKSSTAPNALLIANGIIDWKKSDVGAAAGGSTANFWSRPAQRREIGILLVLVD